MNKWIKKIIAPVLAVSVCAGMLTGCGKNKIDGTKTAIVINKEEVPLGVISFQSRYTQAMFMSFTSADYFDKVADPNIGKTNGDGIREQVINDTEKLVIIRQHAKDYGVELTDDEKAAIKKAAEGYIESNPQEVIDMIGANADHVAEVMELNTISSKMFERIVADVDKNVTDEEAQQSTVTYISVPGATDYGKDGDSRSAKDVAEELLKMLKKEKTPAGTDITDLVRKVEDSLAPVTKSFSANDSSDSSIDSAVAEAVKGLKDGEVADKVIAGKDNECYYVVRMDSSFDKEKTESRKKEIIEERKQKSFNDTVDKWMKEMEKSYKMDVISELKIDSSLVIKMKEKVGEDTSDANK